MKTFNTKDTTLSKDERDFESSNFSNKELVKSVKKKEFLSKVLLWNRNYFNNYINLPVCCSIFQYSYERRRGE